MVLHRVTASAAAAVLLVLGLAACGSDPKPSASSHAPEPTAASSPTGPAAPVLPELAKRNDAVGAKAFVKYWFELANYSIATGNTEQLAAASSQECGSCDALRSSVSRAYRKGRRIEGGALHVIALEHDPRVKPPIFRFALRLEQDPKRVVDSEGKVVSRELGATALFLVAAHRDNGFKFMGLERVDD